MCGFVSIHRCRYNMSIVPQHHCVHAARCRGETKTTMSELHTVSRPRGHACVCTNGGSPHERLRAMRTANPGHATSAALVAASRAVGARAAVGNACDLAKVCKKSPEQVLSAQGASLLYQHTLAPGGESNVAATKSGPRRHSIVQLAGLNVQQVFPWCAGLDGHACALMRCADEVSDEHRAGCIVASKVASCTHHISCCRCRLCPACSQWGSRRRSRKGEYSQAGTLLQQRERANVERAQCNVSPKGRMQRHSKQFKGTTVFSC